MPRFVILQHDHPFLHWDFMLEVGTALRTWRLAAPPSAGADIAATAFGDHRLAYLDYEGPLTGNRGKVLRWDHGEFEEILQNDDQMIVRLRGQKSSGSAELKRAGDEWTFRWTPE